MRALRIRRGLRQAEIASAAGVSPTVVSRLERGHLDAVALATIRRAFRALDVRLELSPRWRGGELHRLLDSGHAALGETVTRRLRAMGWDLRPEVSFSQFGERGSIDLLPGTPGHGLCSSSSSRRRSWTSRI
jgi:transcriptional regulator with XRE-family HTH domain